MAKEVYKTPKRVLVAVRKNQEKVRETQYTFGTYYLDPKFEKIVDDIMHHFSTRKGMVEEALLELHKKYAKGE